MMETRKQRERQLRKIETLKGEIKQVIDAEEWGFVRMDSFGIRNDLLRQLNNAQNELNRLDNLLKERGDNERG